MQKYMGKEYEISQLYAMLRSTQRKVGSAKWWTNFKVIQGERAVLLECVLCGDHLSASNPSQRAGTHFKPGVCRGLAPKPPAAAPADVADVEELEEGGSSSSITTSNKRAAAGPAGIGGYRITADQENRATQCLARFFFKSSVALHLIEQPDLVEAFATLGVTLPGRKALSTTHLDREHARVSESVLAAVQALPLVQLATDGWKRRYAGGGTPLINVMALHPQGGSSFIKVATAAGAVKDSPWIAKEHLAWAKEVGGKEEGWEQRILGVVMDNTKANRGALASMKALHPQWLLLGCQAHALALLIKDLANPDRCTWTAKVYSSALMMSNVINGNEKVRAALRTKQLATPPNKAMAIATHCPTRFAIVHFIGRDLIASKAAIQSLVLDDDAWAAATNDCTHAAEFKAAAVGISGRGRGAFNFYADLEQLNKLVQPICDAIHQLEADAPRLSQMLPIWRQLLTHAQTFDALGRNSGGGAAVPAGRTAAGGGAAAAAGASAARAVLPLFKDRFTKHYDSAWAAAYVVDPIHATRVEATGEWFLPFTQLSNDELAGATGCLMELAGEDADKVEEELGELELGALPVAMARFLPALTTRREVEGKVVLASNSKRQNWWALRGALSFPHLSKVAVKLLSFHVTSCATERNWSLWGNIYVKGRNRLALERAEKLVMIRGNAKSIDHRTSEEEVVLSLLGEK